jgi:hypothetical protein
MVTTLAYLIPIRNVKKSKGVVTCFLIFCSDAEKKEIETEMETRGKEIDFSYTSMKSLFILTVLLDSLSDADDLFSWFKSRKEIREEKMEIMKEFIFLDGWLDEMVGRQVKATS